MFTRGSKLFLGLALAGYLGAVLFGIITNGLAAGGVSTVLSGDGAVDAVLGPLTFGYKGGVGDQMSYSVFMAFAAGCIGMAGAALAFRDGDPEAVAELDNLSSAPAVTAPNDLSHWPIIAAFGVTLMVLGLAVGPALFIIGGAVMVIAAIEWLAKTWSEQATGDPEVNRTIRNRLMYPFELPVGATILIGIIVFSFSRILLTVTKEQAVWVASGLGVLIFAVGIVVAMQPQIRRSVVVGALVAGAVVTIGLGIFGAVRGETEIEVHEVEHAAGITAADYSLSMALGETEIS